MLPNLLFFFSVGLTFNWVRSCIQLDTWSCYYLGKCSQVRGSDGQHSGRDISPKRAALHSLWIQLLLVLWPVFLTTDAHSAEIFTELRTVLVNCLFSKMHANLMADFINSSKQSVFSMSPRKIFCRKPKAVSFFLQVFDIYEAWPGFSKLTVKYFPLPWKSWMYLISTLRTSFRVSWTENCVQMRSIEGCLNILLNVKTCTV